MITLLPCQNNKAHAQLAFRWRNDPKTIAASYVALPKTWDSFWLEYNQCYFDLQDLSPVFVVEGSEPAGFIRFEKATLNEYPDREIVEIMINIAPQYRGEGIGTQALIAAARYMKEKNVFALIADIRKNNRASRIAFEKAGFSFLSERNEYIAKTKENCAIVCYLCKL